MRLNFIKTNPTDNMTVFVLDPLPIEQHREVAQKIIAYGNLCAEQVGFVEHPLGLGADSGHVRLRMMGGEFCGNATRALAAALVDRGYPGVIQNGEVYNISIEVSEKGHPVKCEVVRASQGKYDVSAEMPLHEAISEVKLLIGTQQQRGILVKYDGISHLVFFRSPSDHEEQYIEAVKSILPKMKVGALGIMLFDEERSFLTPVVLVPETNTEIWERGCGSGSAAVATVMAVRLRKNLNLNINQPGGCLNVSCKWGDEGLEQVVLAGPVSIVAEGTVNI